MQIKEITIKEFLRLSGIPLLEDLAYGAYGTSSCVLEGGQQHLYLINTNQLSNESLILFSGVYGLKQHTSLESFVKNHGHIPKETLNLSNLSNHNLYSVVYLSRQITPEEKNLMISALGVIPNYLGVLTTSRTSS